MAMAGDELLTAKQVAEGPMKGKASKAWVLELAKRGELPCLRLGPKKVYFRADQVDAFIASRWSPARIEAAAS
jgi:hypothetical protein